MQLESARAMIFLPAAGPGQSHVAGPGKFDFLENCSKDHWMTYYLFILHAKFSAVWGIFV